MPYGGKEHKANNGVEYYAKSNLCNDRWKLSSKGEKVDNAIGFSSPPYTGRAYESIPCSTHTAGKKKCQKLRSSRL